MGVSWARGDEMRKMLMCVAVVIMAAIALMGVNVDKLTVTGVWDERGLPCASAGDWVLDGEFIVGEEIVAIYADFNTENVYDDKMLVAICSDGYYECYL